MKRHILKFTYASSIPEVGRTWCGRTMAVEKIINITNSMLEGLCGSCKRSYYSWKKHEVERNRKLREKSHDGV